MRPTRPWLQSTAEPTGDQDCWSLLCTFCSTKIFALTHFVASQRTSWANQCSSALIGAYSKASSHPRARPCHEPDTASYCQSMCVCGDQICALMWFDLLWDLNSSYLIQAISEDGSQFLFLKPFMLSPLWQFVTSGNIGVPFWSLLPSPFPVAGSSRKLTNTVSSCLSWIRDSSHAIHGVTHNASNELYNYILLWDLLWCSMTWSCFLPSFDKRRHLGKHQRWILQFPVPGQHTHLIWWVGEFWGQGLPVVSTASR